MTATKIAEKHSPDTISFALGSIHLFQSYIS